MKQLILSLVSLFVVAPSLTAQEIESDACTSILVSAGASSDGSVMITYSADAPFLPKLLVLPAADHAAGTMTDVWGWEDDDRRGSIPQVARTHGVVGLVNEHQLALGETTTGGRRELRDPDGLLDYDALMLLTLQRARTAREAIDVIDALCREHGYRSSGETFSIADPREAWMMELIGKGKGRKGIVWVAARIPEGFVSAHANMSRIGSFPMNDPDNWRFAPDVVDFAVEKGLFDPGSGEAFSFRAAYHGAPKPSSLRACATRVWSVFRRAAPGLALSSDYHRGVKGAEAYPLFVQPDRKLSVHDVMDLMRDHYEGTPFDMTVGLAAGPYSSPIRHRPLSFEHEGRRYMWERPISTQQAGFVMVSQCRAQLPDPIGGICWFTPDDAYTSCFVPLYCGATELPRCYVQGSYDRCDLDSAWWIFNLVSNQAYDRWSRIVPAILARREANENALFAATAEFERQVTSGDPPALHAELVNAFVRDHGERVFADWKELWLDLLTRHVDGYVDGKGEGYPAAWLDRVIEECGDARAPEGREPTRD